MPQRFGLFLQILEVLRAGNLRHLACLFALINLDTQDLYLLFQLFLASDHLAGHPAVGRPPRQRRLDDDDPAFAGLDPHDAQLKPGEGTAIALAVWDGAAKDRNGQKSVSVWVPLVMGK